MILGNVENYFKRPPSIPVTTARDKIFEQILLKSASERTPNDTVVWGALPDIADTQVDDLLQTDQSVNEEYCPATIL